VKLSIAGTEYDYLAALSDATLGTLRDLQKETGLGPRAINEQLLRVSADPRLLDADPDVLNAMLALVFLCKTHAKEGMTFDEVLDLRMADVGFVVEDKDLEPVDPTVPPAEVPKQPSAGGRSRSRSRTAASS
jgi:hypothetical protein